MSGVRVPLRPYRTARDRADLSGLSGPTLLEAFGMPLLRLVGTGLFSAVILTPMAAQGIPRGARASTAAANAAPRFMVANPFAYATADSVPAVRIGTAMREEVKSTVGHDFQVVEQTQMNDALKQYGYPIDAILSPALATHAGQEHPGALHRQFHDGQGRRRPLPRHRTAHRRQRRRRQRRDSYPERRRDSRRVRQAAGRRVGAGHQVHPRCQGLYRSARLQGRQGHGCGQQGH